MIKNSILLAILFISAQTVCSQNATYKLSKKIQVGDENSWDYVVNDSLNQRLFFTHSTKLLVYSSVSDKLVGTINNLNGAHGVALDYKRKKGYLTNGKSNSVVRFDLSTLTVIDTLAINGVKPDAIVFDQHSDRVFVFNGKSKNLIVIDPQSWSIVKDISLGGKPEFSVADRKGFIYVNLEDVGKVLKINTKSLEIDATLNLPEGEEPASMSIDLQHDLLFSGCANKKIYLIDLNKFKLTDSLENGEDVDALIFDPHTNRLFSSNEEGTVYVHQREGRNQFHLIQIIPTQFGSKTMGYNPVSKKVYVPSVNYLEDHKTIDKESAAIMIYSISK